nr:2840_t:CDS:2 [Entrophospora candida]
MPNIDQLKKPFTKSSENQRLNVNRQDIFYRDDIQTLFIYSLVGIAGSLGVAGIVYVVETIITSLLTETRCSCHIINPHKTRILMWKVKDGYHLRIGIQKFTSQEQQDRNGEQLSTSLKAAQPLSLDNKDIQLITYALIATAVVGALKGFYEESLKNTVESKTQEFKTLLERNITHGQKTQKALVAIALGFEDRQQKLSGLFLRRDVDYRTLLSDIQEQSSKETSDLDYLAEEIAV